jgi:hypothetical protein
MELAKHYKKHFSMKLYGTQKTKEEIEEKIYDLKSPKVHWDGIYVSDSQQTEIEILEQLIADFVVLPEVESYGGLIQSQGDLRFVEFHYDKGVIINPNK